MTADVVTEENVDNPVKGSRAFFLGALGVSIFRRQEFTHAALKANCASAGFWQGYG
jgi:hypothetical protein